MAPKGPKVPECPNGLANLLQIASVGKIRRDQDSDGTPKHRVHRHGEGRFSDQARLSVSDSAILRKSTSDQGSAVTNGFHMLRALNHIDMMVFRGAVEVGSTVQTAW